MNKHFDFIFHNNKLNVITDNFDRPWFIAKEIANVLGYETYHMLRMTLPNDIIRLSVVNAIIGAHPLSGCANSPILSVNTSSSTPLFNSVNLEASSIGLSNKARYITLINEPGVYRLATLSKRSEAVEFQNWIYYELLPRIRQTGMYTDIDIINIIRERPDLLNTILDDQEAAMNTWIEKCNEDWVHESIKYEHLFDDPYDKLKYDIE